MEFIFITVVTKEPVTVTTVSKNYVIVTLTMETVTKFSVSMKTYQGLYKHSTLNKDSLTVAMSHYMWRHFSRTLTLKICGDSATFFIYPKYLCCWNDLLQREHFRRPWNLFPRIHTWRCQEFCNSRKHFWWLYKHCDCLKIVWNYGNFYSVLYKHVKYCQGFKKPDEVFQDCYNQGTYFQDYCNHGIFF